MTIRISKKERGIALIIVMIVILILAVLAGGFAYSMKVETKLARNSSWDSEMQMLGKSGVELARYILAMHLRIPEEAQYTALNQKWAGGPATTNELLMGIELKDNKLGAGTFSIEMTDLERKFNLSAIREGNTDVLQRALEMIGVDAVDVSTIVDSYLDWIDPDENTHIHGAESETYLHLDPKAPYYAKNGLMDDVSEFLMVKGVRPEIYWGTARTGLPTGTEQALARPKPRTAFMAGNTDEMSSGVGLYDLFTTISGAAAGVNVNTASAEVLQLIPGIDPSLAHAIVDTRAGMDRVDGTEDDLPYLNIADLGAVPGIDGSIAGVIRQYLTTRSFLFEVRVEASIGEHKRTYVALLHRRNQQDVGILYSHWL